MGEFKLIILLPSKRTLSPPYCCTSRTPHICFAKFLYLQLCRSRFSTKVFTKMVGMIAGVPFFLLTLISKQLIIFLPRHRCFGCSLSLLFARRYKIKIVIPAAIKNSIIIYYLWFVWKIINNGTIKNHARPSFYESDILLWHTEDDARSLSGAFSLLHII